MKKTTVLLADDHLIVRQGLNSIISGQDDMEVVGEAGDGRQAVQMARDLKPDIIVMDIGMPLLNGLGAASQIIGESIPTRILILSSYEDDDHVHALAEAGVAGYLTKQAASKELITAIRDISKGNAYFSAPILRRLLYLYRNTAGKEQAPSRTPPLTSREQEVLQLVAEGHGNKQIASTLVLSIKTVEKHRQRLMDKLEIHDIAGLTRYAIARGVVESTTRIISNSANLDAPEGAS